MIRSVQGRLTPLPILKILDYVIRRFLILLNQPFHGNMVLLIPVSEQFTVIPSHTCHRHDAAAPEPDSAQRIDPGSSSLFYHRFFICKSNLVSHNR